MVNYKSLVKIGLYTTGIIVGGGAGYAAGQIAGLPNLISDSAKNIVELFYGKTDLYSLYNNIVSSISIRDILAVGGQFSGLVFTRKIIQGLSSIVK